MMPSADITMLGYYPGVDCCAGRGRIAPAGHGRRDRHPAPDTMTRGTGWRSTNPWAVNSVPVPASVGPEVLPSGSVGGVCAADGTVGVPGRKVPRVNAADAAAVLVNLNEAAAAAPAAEAVTR